MKKIFAIVVILLAIGGIVAGVEISKSNLHDGTNTISDESSFSLTEIKARNIAERSCIKGGMALGSGIHDKNGRNWSFEANLNATREGCTSSCVVSEMTKTAEVKWSCAVKPVACTMDAKQCPDGSYIGRSGPNCEFICPK